MDVLRWWFDSALNFAPHLLIVSAILAAVSAFERQWMVALPLAMVAVALGAWHATGRTLLERPSANRSNPSLALATANVESRFGADRVVELLGTHPDVLVIEEAPFEDRPPTSLKAYPHVHKSQPPWLQVWARDVASEFTHIPTPDRDDGRAIVRFEVPLADSRLTVVALHALAPVRLSNFRGRTRQFAIIEEIARAVEGPLVVLGDLNATVNSPALRSLLRRTGLRSATAKGPETPTWPVVAGPLGLRLDHVLVRGVAICEVKTAPISDHRAIVVGVALPEARGE